MSNNLFYKALASISTAGIVLIAGMQVTTTLKKGNSAEDQLAKSMVELKKERKEALSEVKSIRSEILKELSTVRSNSLTELKSNSASAVKDVKDARKDALAELKQSGSGNKTQGVWLLVRVGNNGRESGGRDIPVALEKIPMNDMAQCQLQGALVKSAEDINNYGKRIGVVCIESK